MERVISLLHFVNCLIKPFSIVGISISSIFSIFSISEIWANAFEFFIGSIIGWPVLERFPGFSTPTKRIDFITFSPVFIKFSRWPEENVSWATGKLTFSNFIPFWIPSVNPCRISDIVSVYSLIIDFDRKCSWSEKWVKFLSSDKFSQSNSWILFSRSHTEMSFTFSYRCAMWLMGSRIITPRIFKLFASSVGYSFFLKMEKYILHTSALLR